MAIMPEQLRTLLKNTSHFQLHDLFCSAKSNFHQKLILGLSTTLKALCYIQTVCFSLRKSINSSVTQLSCLTELQAFKHFTVVLALQQYTTHVFLFRWNEELLLFL